MLLFEQAQGEAYAFHGRRAVTSPNSSFQTSQDLHVGLAASFITLHSESSRPIKLTNVLYPLALCAATKPHFASNNQNPNQANALSNQQQAPPPQSTRKVLL